MVITSRLMWLRQQVLAGLHVRLSMGPALDPSKCKIKMVVEQQRAMAPAASAMLLEVIDALMERSLTHVCVDRGHRHSSGSAVVAIWMQPPNSHSTAEEPGSTGVETAPTGTAADAATGTAAALAPGEPRNDEHEEHGAEAVAELAAEIKKPEETEGTGIEQHDGNEQEQEKQDADGDAEPLAAEPMEPEATEEQLADGEDGRSGTDEHEGGDSGSSNSSSDSNEHWTAAQEAQLQEATTAADTIADQIIMLQETIEQLQGTFPPARLQIAQLQRELMELHDRHTCMMQEVVDLEEARDVAQTRTDQSCQEGSTG